MPSRICCPDNRAINPAKISILVRRTLSSSLEGLRVYVADRLS
ncbi:MAG: hypothetical protein WB630_07770 [Candidatus Acidiferrales bacterium]